MYVPPEFKQTKLPEVIEFVKAHNFGTLINTLPDGRLWATHIPFLVGKDVNGKAILAGHISRTNPQWKNFSSEQEILIIFQGAHAYVSSSWYDDTVTLPTWNYQAVHIYGRIRIVEGEALYAWLEKLVDTHETETPDKVVLRNLPQDMVHREMQNIVGFEISINTVHAADKLSQNRTPHDHAKIIQKLNDTEEPLAKQVAEAMQKHTH